MTPEIKIWRTIKIGTFENKNSLLSGLLKRSVLIENQAKELIDQIDLASTTIELDLVVKSASELGLTSGQEVEYRWVYDKAKSIGLEVCPGEVGPQLCLQQLPPEDNRFVNWVLRIAMNVTPGGNIFTFMDGRYLYYNSAGLILGIDSNDMMPGSGSGALEPVKPETKFVFVKPRK